MGFDMIEMILESLALINKGMRIDELHRVYDGVLVTTTTGEKYIWHNCGQIEKLRGWKHG